CMPHTYLPWTKKLACFLKKLMTWGLPKAPLSSSRTTRDTQKKTVRLAAAAQQDLTEGRKKACLKPAYVYRPLLAGRGIYRQMRCAASLPLMLIGCLPLPNTVTLVYRHVK